MNNNIEDEVNFTKMNINAHYPTSEVYDYQVSLERINLDEERERDINRNNGFIITKRQNIKKDLKAQENAPAITTGLLTCRLDRTTDIFNISYTAQFSFTDSKLNKLSYVTSTEGDAIVDSDQLDAVLSKCKLLQNEVDSLAGVRVSCNQSEGTVVETQDFTYSLFYFNLICIFTSMLIVYWFSL